MQYSCRTFSKLELVVVLADQVSADTISRNISSDMLKSDCLNYIRSQEQPRTANPSTLVAFHENFELLLVPLLSCDYVMCPQLRNYVEAWPEKFIRLVLLLSSYVA